MNQIYSAEFSPQRRALSGIKYGELDGQVATTALQYMKAERLRALGIGGPRRHPLLPDVPTSLIPLGSSPKEFADFLRKDVARQAENRGR